MNTEQKAQAYDKAIERAKEIIKDYGIDGLWHAQRILEKTLGEVDGYQTDDGILDHKAAITAVKKLYEKKPAENIKFDNEFENQLSNLLVSVLNGEHEYNEGFVKYVAQSLLGYAKNELKPTEWSHEDDVMVHDILGWLPTKTRPEYNQRRADWIKSLKNRVQPKYEWSEEDEYMLNETIQHLKELIRIDKAKHLGCDVQYYQRDIDWLEALRQRYTWKPTEEQMRALHDMNLTGDISYVGQGQTLIELYNDLKKL